MPDYTILDEVGFWSEIKHEIIQEYATAYTIILKRHPRLWYGYIDAFAGPGESISEATGTVIRGSPLVALDIRPQFQEYHLIELDPQKADHLRSLVADRSNVFVHQGDCNDILLHRVFPHFRYEDFRRALCFLDPYKLQINWDVIQKAGRMRSVEISLNFPIMDINRNVLRKNLHKVDPRDSDRMTVFWGDTSWRQIAYSNVSSG